MSLRCVGDGALGLGRWCRWWLLVAALCCRTGRAHSRARTAGSRSIPVVAGSAQAAPRCTVCAASTSSKLNQSYTHTLTLYCHRRPPCTLHAPCSLAHYVYRSPRARRYTPTYIRTYLNTTTTTTLYLLCIYTRCIYIYTKLPYSVDHATLIFIAITISLSNITTNVHQIILVSFLSNVSLMCYPCYNIFLVASCFCISSIFLYTRQRVLLIFPFCTKSDNEQCRLSIKHCHMVVHHNQVINFNPPRHPFTTMPSLQ